jgi:hypothetical protein
VGSEFLQMTAEDMAFGLRDLDEYGFGFGEGLGKQGSATNLDFWEVGTGY